MLINKSTLKTTEITLNERVLDGTCDAESAEVKRNTVDSPSS